MTSPPAAGLRRPGTGDGIRATAGVLAGLGGALLIAGLVTLLAGDPVAGAARSAGQTRAQLAIQALVMAGAALLLVEGLRLGRPPQSRDPFAAGPPRPDVPVALISVIALGLVCAIGALITGPLVSELWPALSDPETTTDGLGIGSGLGPDLGAAVVIAGLVPLGEELLFRGVLVGAWVRAGRPVVAVVSSALLFGVAHATVGGYSVAVTLLLGALFAATLLASGSLGAPVLGHATLNAVVLVQAGLTSTAGILALIVVVSAATAAAMRLSPLMWWPAPAGRLTAVTAPAGTPDVDA